MPAPTRHEQPARLQRRPLEDELGAIEALGGISRQYLNHRHEGAPSCDWVADTFGAPLYCNAVSRCGFRGLDHLGRNGEINVQGLADVIGGTQENVSRALGLLTNAGIVTRRPEGRIVWYSVAEPHAFPLRRTRFTGHLGGKRGDHPMAA